MLKTVFFDRASQILRCLSDLQSRKLSPSFARKAAIFLSCRSEGYSKTRWTEFEIFLPNKTYQVTKESQKVCQF